MRAMVKTAKKVEVEKVHRVHHRNGLHRNQNRAFEMLNSFQTTADAGPAFGKRLVFEPKTQERFEHLNGLVQKVFYNRSDIRYFSKKKIRILAIAGGPAYEEVLGKVEQALDSTHNYNEAKAVLCR